MLEYRVQFLFSGIGGAALGVLAASVPGARFVFGGAVDFDPVAVRDFERLTGHPCHLGDLATMGPADLAAVGEAPPDVVVTSPPCQGNSGCLPARMAETPKYRDMNALAVRGLFLALEAWPEKRPRLILMENVPRIMQRSRDLLDTIIGMLHSYGYAVNETVRDCGVVGGLAQRRRRYLLVARHVETTQDWWREPHMQRVRGVGEVLGDLPIPLPSSREGGPLHALPKLSAENWLRLALVPPGGDWRDLPPKVTLKARAGRQNGGFGVESWTDPAHAVIAEGTVWNARVSVADPRPGYTSRSGATGVHEWADPGRTVIGSDNGMKGLAVADPRLPARFHGEHGVDGWDRPAGTVLGSATVSKGANVADPRLSDRPGRHEAKYRVTDGAGPAGTVIGADRVGSGAPSVADPRVTCKRNEGSVGVRGWDQPSACIIGAATLQNHPSQVADPRVSSAVGWIVRGPDGPELHGVDLDLDNKQPMANPPIILAEDGTWHRPMTDLELAALQSLPTRLDGEWLTLTGSREVRRRGIGNVVPPLSAEAIGRKALHCLVASDAGGVTISCDPIWVAPNAEVSSV